jgi:tRNA(His) 5'-end guanylyltransferase
MSQVVVMSPRLQALCEYVCRVVDNAQKHARDKFITDYKENYNRPRWYRRKGRNLTFKEAEERLEEMVAHGDFSSCLWADYGINNPVGGKAKEIAVRLRRSCRTAPSVAVSAEDMEYLVNWAGEEEVDRIFGHTLR